MDANSAVRRDRLRLCRRKCCRSTGHSERKGPAREDERPNEKARRNGDEKVSSLFFSSATVSVYAPYITFLSKVPFKFLPLSVRVRVSSKSTTKRKKELELEPRRKEEGGGGGGSSSGEELEDAWLDRHFPRLASGVVDWRLPSELTKVELPPSAHTRSRRRRRRRMG